MNHRDAVLLEAGPLKTLVDTRGDIVLLHVFDGGIDGPVEGIPGAIAVNSAMQFAAPGGGLKGARPLPAIADLQRDARQWGIRQTSHVVLYDDHGGLKAARGWWVLRWAGLENVRLLDGGLKAWRDAGYATSDLKPEIASGDVMLSAGHLAVLDAEGAEKQARDAILLDARGASVFHGDPAAGTGGHIPGAISVPASDNLDAEGRFLPTDVLYERYRAAGADGRLSIGVSCGSGISAAHDIAALAILGAEAALFPGSWSAWQADPERPIAFGSGAGHAKARQTG